MSETLEESSTNLKIPKIIIIAFIAGVVGTFIMDLVMVGTFLLLGEPLDTFIEFLADGVNDYFAEIGLDIEISNVIALILHYITGPTVSIVFVLVASQFDAFRIDLVKKYTALGFAGSQVMCLVFFTPVIILLEYSLSKSIIFLVMTSFFHSVFGIVFGLITGYGLLRFVYSGD